jgi:hypothetical protein
MDQSKTTAEVERTKTLAPAAESPEPAIEVSGKLLKTATIRDEELVQGVTVTNVESFVTSIRKRGVKADIFAFSQKPDQPTPLFSHFHGWDNLAVIDVSTYDAWLNGLSQDTRRNVRRAAKRGIEVKVVAFDDALVRGIKEIYDETPHRQGRHFWHYGKDFEVVKAECATYLERSQFIGAFDGTELIGFAKLVFVDRTARILHILSKIKHQDKRPTNALVAKAVEFCAQSNISQLAYCQYSYGKGDDDSLTTFKRHCGFRRIDFPRFFVPLTLKGKLALMLRLHLGIKPHVPNFILAALRRARSRYYDSAGQKRSTNTDGESTSRETT